MVQILLPQQQTKLSQGKPWLFGDWIYKAFDEFYEKCDEPREECRRIFHEVIGKHMPTTKSQEAVMDVENIVS